MHIGIIVDQLDTRELNMHLISRLHERFNKSSDFNLTVFFTNYCPPLAVMPCAYMPINEAWCFEGPLLATTLATALKMKFIPTSFGKAFYVWELEWIGKQLPYEVLSKTYGNRQIKLLTRSDYYKEILEDCFNRDDVTRVDDWNLENIASVL